MKKRILGGVLTGALLFWFGAFAAQASVVEVTVLGTAGPWNWATGGLNSALNYGPASQDFTAPTTINLFSALGLSPGDSVFILYKSGLTSAFGVPFTDVNQNGYVGSISKDDALGSSDEPLPSMYMPIFWGINSVDPGNAGSYGVFLQALVAAITDSGGGVLFPFPIGGVFAVGCPTCVQGFGIGISFNIPAGGALLQLGFNDDIFGDNTGSQQVCVGSTSAEVEACASSVPEPGTLVLVGAGLLGLGVLLRRRKTIA
jgi:hypothetical protein